MYLGFKYMHIPELEEYLTKYGSDFEEYKKKGAFRILTDTYVTEDSGTGVVHQVCDQLTLF